jgi:hypothetical protein
MTAVAATLPFAFKVTPNTVTIKGDIYRADGSVAVSDVYAGGTTTPFDLPVGTYYYEFAYVGTTIVPFDIHLPKAKADCNPSHIDPKNGTVDQVTNFTV